MHFLRKMHTDIAFPFQHLVLFSKEEEREVQVGAASINNKIIGMPKLMN